MSLPFRFSKTSNLFLCIVLSKKWSFLWKPLLTNYSIPTLSITTGLRREYDQTPFLILLNSIVSSGSITYPDEGHFTSTIWSFSTNPSGLALRNLNSLWIYKPQASIWILFWVYNCYFLTGPFCCMIEWFLLTMKAMEFFLFTSMHTQHLLEGSWNY